MGKRKERRREKRRRRFYFIKPKNESKNAGEVVSKHTTPDNFIIISIVSAACLLGVYALAHTGTKTPNFTKSNRAKYVFEVEQGNPDRHLPLYDMFAVKDYRRDE